MASTKEMQDRAKARKQAEKKAEQFRINEHKFTELMFRLSDILITDNPNQDYAQTEQSLWTAKELIRKHQLNATDFQQMLKLRETFDSALAKKYNIQFANDLGALLQDVGADMRNAGVPQNVRVLSGFLDTLISVLGIQCGAINIVAA